MRFIEHTMLIELFNQILDKLPKLFRSTANSWEFNSIKGIDDGHFLFICENKVLPDWKHNLHVVICTESDHLLRSISFSALPQNSK